MALSSELWKANHQRRSCSLPPDSWSSQKFSKQPVKLFKLQALVDKGHGCYGRGWEVKCLQGLRDLGEGSTFSRQVSDCHCRAINREFSRVLLGLFWSSLWMCKLNYILRQPLGEKKNQEKCFCFHLLLGKASFDTWCSCAVCCRSLPREARCSLASCHHLCVQTMQGESCYWDLREYLPLACWYIAEYM